MRKRRKQSEKAKIYTSYELLHEERKELHKYHMLNKGIGEGEERNM